MGHGRRPGGGEGPCGRLQRRSDLRSLEMAVRGLHHHVHHEMLPPDCPVDVQRIPWNLAPEFVIGPAAKTAIRPAVKGQLVAWWTDLAIEGEQPELRASLFCHDDDVLYLGTTGEAGLVQCRLHAKSTVGQEQTRGARELLSRIGPKQVRVPRDPDGRPIVSPQRAITSAPNRLDQPHHRLAPDAQHEYKRAAGLPLRVLARLRSATGFRRPGRLGAAP